MPARRRFLLWAAATGAAAAAQAGSPAIRVAVAANFAPVLDRVISRFTARTGIPVRMSAASTGALYAQIVHGAPYDVLLAADRERPALLEAEGRTVAGSRFTYALGRLALWSADAERVDDRGEVLRAGGFRHLAIANPKTAPYGAAAVEALQRLGVYGRVKPRLVQGTDVGQVFQFVASARAELGFVAYAQVVAWRGGSYWLVPAGLHAPIEQQAVWLARAAGSADTGAFLAYLRGKEARRLIARHGYDLPETGR